MELSWFKNLDIDSEHSRAGLDSFRRDRYLDKTDLWVPGSRVPSTPRSDARGPVSIIRDEGRALFADAVAKPATFSDLHFLLGSGSHHPHSSPETRFRLDARDRLQQG